ncbi:hypothetical protein ATCC90586_004459 [Pythium insidiosum]|nr:hypothetical protein ATCC90586_004459 [Pythium insidiosum]
MPFQAELEGEGVAALRSFLRERMAQSTELRALLDASDARRLTPTELRRCADWLRELRAADPSTPTLRHLLAANARVVPRVVAEDGGSDLATVAADEKARQRYLAKRRKQLQRLDEEMRYGRLVRNVKKETASKELQRNLKSVRQHMSIGANMIVSRIVAFIVVYMVSRPLFDSETKVLMHRVIAGLAGAIGMMLLEMVLFITRAAKYEAIESYQRKQHEGVF